MSHLRVASLPVFALLLGAWSSASGQSVRSTHSGLLYFFDGYVFIGDEQVQQKFGRFPEIGEGRVLRTELGRAEVLLTPGVVLRIDENSAIRMVSDNLSDTRVELVRGSAILEVSHEAANPPDLLIYKNWQLRAPQDSIARISAEPAQVRALSGTAVVSAENTPDSVTIKRGEVLPLASVLVADQAATPAADDFNVWAMNRSSIVSEDNSIGAGITDDPDQVDSSGVALGNFSYFPQTGIPSLGITYPYGLSFWSPYQSWVNPYLSYYPYGLLYQRLPISGTVFRPGSIYPRPITISPLGARPFGVNFPRTYSPTMPRPAVITPHVAAPAVHGIHR
jgi:FecR protein